MNIKIRVARCAIIEVSICYSAQHPTSIIYYLLACTACNTTSFLLLLYVIVDRGAWGVDVNCYRLPVSKIQDTALYSGFSFLNVQEWSQNHHVMRISTILAAVIDFTYC